MTNQQLADIFQTIANLLEIKGEVIYKILAYRKAAESLINLGQDVNGYWREGKLTEIPGVGNAIAEKIDELLTTGKLDYLEKLKGEVPITLVELLQVPDLGPKKVALFWHQLGIINLEELETAARIGRLRVLPGMGEKSEAKIVAGIEALSRRTTRTPLARAWPVAQDLLKWLLRLPGVKAASTAGSLRRMRVTVGDLDLLVAANASQPVMEAFTNRPDVVRVLGRGEIKASVEFDHGMNAQLWVHPPDHYGTALQYATGSKDHNVRLRELALKQGLSLSEHALCRINRAESSQLDDEILCATEEEVYAALKLPYIPPELREDRGEVQAARLGKLPNLIELKNIQSELHAHTTYSDGKNTVKEMAEAAVRRGMKVLAITDHSPSLGITGGLTYEKIKQQRIEIDAVQREMGDSIHLLQGSEVEIRADGSLDYPDEILAEFDIVCASLHVSLRQPREKVTERLLNAIRNPNVDMIGHPVGRIIPNREGADLDMEAVFKASAESGIVLEINAHPARLDLDDVHARRAIEMGIHLAINTDAHSPSDMDLLHFGVSTARRGWVEADDVINTWETGRLLEWLRR